MSQRTLTIALVVSLVVNVFVVGAVVGAFGMRHRVEEQRMRPPSGNPLMRVTEQLPKELRARYVARMRAEGQNNRPRMEEAREARKEAVRAMTAEPYDAAAASAALARARAAEMATRESIENAVVEFSADLDQEQRRVIAQTLRGGPRGPRGDRDRRHEPPGRGDRPGPPEPPTP